MDQMDKNTVEAKNQLKESEVVRFERLESSGGDLGMQAIAERVCKKIDEVTGDYVMSTDEFCENICVTYK